MRPYSGLRIANSIFQAFHLIIAVDTAIELSASIVLYRSDLSKFESTIRHLRIAATRARISLEVIIIDQSGLASYSEQVRYLCNQLGNQLFKLSHFITQKNLGYGGGHNVALEMGVGRYHLILNPDVEVHKNSLTAALACFAQHPSVALIAPIALDAQGNESYIAKRYPTVLTLFARAFLPKGMHWLVKSHLQRYEIRDLPRDPPLQEILLASGCCMLLRGSVLASVCGFDERYFMYFEDFDLTLRAASQGSTVRNSRVIINHYGGNAATKGFMHQYWFIRSAWLFFSKWGWRLF